jgi:GNAT superfamily N-acetyltransferase
MTPDEVLEQTQWDFFWVTPDATVVDRPEIAYIRCPRDVQYLNTVTRTRATPAQLSALTGEVAEAHDRVRSRWLVCPGNRSEALERTLADHGWSSGPDHDGYTIELQGYVPRACDGLSVRAVQSWHDLLAWFDVCGRAFDEFRAPAEDEIRLELERCTRPGARTSRYVVWDDATGQPLTAAGMNLYPELRFGFLWAGGTVPEARGRGAYSAIVAARIAHARRLGFSRVGLYARTTTSAPIVAKQGFARCGRMTYWDRPPQR